ncbi:MAG: hypothetical protein ACR2Q3_16150 [Woeseiaceae bacterium]
MKSFFKWLIDRFGKDQPAEPSALRKATVRRVPKPRPPKPAARPQADFSSKVQGEIVDGGPGKNILMRNKHVREDTGTHETLKILDDSILESIEEDGIDPYNTGRFDRSKSWDSSRSRK